MNILVSEFQPSTALAPYIQSYWFGNFNVQRVEDFSQSVLPNGCIELIIHLTSDHCELSKDSETWTTSPEFILVGLYEKPYEVQFSRNVQVFGIRFFPDGIRNIFGVPPSEFLATYEDGTQVLGQKLREFCSRIRTEKSTDAQVKLANEFIMRQLDCHKKSFDYTHLAMKLIRQKRGMAGYQELIEQIPISARQLQREFKCLYGVTVKDYMRLARINAIHNYMLANHQKLTELSHDLNFTDQSHFIREFRTYSGVAPRKFAKNRDQFIVYPPIDK